MSGQLNNLSWMALVLLYGHQAMHHSMHGFMHGFIYRFVYRVSRYDKYLSRGDPKVYTVNRRDI